MRAARAGVAIEHINQSYIRKEDLVQRVLAKCGDAPGLVHVLFAMEACPSYRRWHDQMSGKTYWRGDAGKYLHYYFYFIAEELGLCCMRVPTWAPFGLQFYCNGHRMLALSRQLTRLRLLGLIKKVAHTYRYYLTRLGRSAIAAAGSFTRFNIVPAIAGVH